MGNTTTTRLSVNINKETEAALKELAGRHSTTVTEIVRRAVGVYKFLDDETTEHGSRVQLVSEDSNKEIHFVS